MRANGSDSNQVEGTARFISGRFRSPLLLAGFLLLLLLVVLINQLWLSRQEAIRNAEQMTRTLTILLEQRISSDFDRLDALLSFAAQEFLPEEIASMPPSERAASAARLARLVADFPEVAGAYVFDAEGRLQLASDVNTASFSISDRPHFHALRDDAQLDIVFADPLLARATGQPAIVQSRAIRDQYGRFLGIVNAIYHLDTLNTQIARIDVGSGGVTLLRNSETTRLVARHPRGSEADFGQPLPEDNPIRRRMESGEREGFLQYVASTDGHRRIGTFRMLERYPFYVQVAFSEADYLAGWRRQAWLLLGILLLLGVPVLVTLLRLQRADAREQAATEKWRAQQRLVSESEGLLRRVIDAMPHIVIVKDADGRFQLVNEALASLYGSSPEDMVGKDDADFNPNREQVEFYRRNIREIIASGTQQVVQEASTDVATGRVHHYQSVKVPFIGHSGAPSVLVVATDITDLCETQARLRASEERMAYVLEATREGLWDWSIIEDCVDHNAEWGRILGLPDLPSSHPVSFFAERIHVDDREAVMARISAALEMDCDYISEHRLVWPDGRIVWVHDRGRVVLRDDEGRPLRMVGSIRDITDRKQSDLALVEAKQAAEAASVAKSRFLATISHEIRTPMNGILGMAQMLVSASMTDAERRHCARTILTSGQTLMALLNDVLDLSKVEAGKLSLEMSTIDPQQILEETQALFFDSARAKGLRIESSWNGRNGSRYLADPHRLRQMIANLVDNAIKFTDRGEIRLVARELSGEASRVLLEFSVSDTGIGLTSDQMGLLFKPFSQADSSTSREYGGSGLGLSIVSSLAKLMNGEVGVDSEPGSGSRFWVRVRVERASTADESSQSERIAVVRFQAKDYPKLRGRVLIVEDAVTSQQVLQTLFAQVGIESVLAENGRAAVALVVERGERFDAILMDLEMPLMDGFEATGRIRLWEASAGRTRVPIVAISADAFSKDRFCSQDVDMDGFLAKPIVVEDLLNLLERWLPKDSSLPCLNPEIASLRPHELDISKFLELCDDLRPMLAQGRFDSLDRFSDLEAMVVSTPVAECLQRVRQLLDDFEFDKASAALTALCEDLVRQRASQ